MIKVDRASVVAPAILTDPKGAGLKETGRAIAFFVSRKGKEPAFGVYKEKEVKQALEQVFRMKCAYCESSYRAVMPFPVEHWRPKGRVTLDDGSRRKTGYFWLAAKWENLYVSCSDCNGERELVELPTGVEKKMGKLDHFPLADETKRASAPGEENHEAPLLLDPCSDDPGQHLEFFDNGAEKAILRPRGGSLKGAQSIGIYALNRLGLVRERQELAGQVMLLKSQVDTNLNLLDTPLAPGQEGMVRQNIQTALVALMRMREPSRPYTALARQEVDDFLVPILRRFQLPPLP